MRARVALLVAVLGILAYSIVGYVRSEARFGHPGPLTDPTDFVAFYCGGRVLAERRDPYRAEPLRSCQEAAFAESRIEMIPHLVVPAPLPPYALAAFAAFSRLPFRAACVVFLLLCVGAIAATIALAIRLARIDRFFIAATAIVALAVGSLYIGQIVPLVVAALCASAYCIRTNRIVAASAFALCTAIEPHVGLPAVLGLFVLERRSRVPLTAGAAALGALSLVAGGVALNREYLTLVLPAHALSEVGNFGGQYSLTALLFQLGVPAEAALRAGELSYGAMVALGVVLGGRLRRTYGDPAFLVLAPPACALAGGVFIHIHQMAVALPFAYLLAERARPRAVVYGATALLAVPWQSIFEIALGPFFPPHVHVDFVKTLAPFAGAGLLADETWRAWIGLLGARDGRSTLEKVLFKAPTWLALGSLLAVAVRVTSARLARTAEPRTPYLAADALRSAIRR